MNRNEELPAAGFFLMIQVSDEDLNIDVLSLHVLISEY